MISKIIEEESVVQARNLIYESERIVIITHTSPDGDAVGSSLAFYHFLKRIEKDAIVIFPDELPAFLTWMPGVENAIIHRSQSEQAEAAIKGSDLIICLDFNEYVRTAGLAPILEHTKTVKILIDHHTNPIEGWSVKISHPELSATCELVFRLICRMGHATDIDHNCATCIYTGIMTDTGNFSYSSDDIELYYIVTELLKRGVNKTEIYHRVNQTFSENRLRLTGHLLANKMKIYPEYNTAITTLTIDEKNQYGYKKGDTEGFVNQPLMIKDVIQSIFISEDSAKIKLSFRSIGEFPVNEIASKYFGGGGHKNAAGGEAYNQTINEVIQKIEEFLPEYKEKLNKVAEL